MKLEDTLLYQYELSDNPLKYKKTINFFPKKLNERIKKNHLTPDEFNSIIKACIEIERNILFLLYEQNNSLQLKDIHDFSDSPIQLNNINSYFNDYLLKSDYVLNSIQNKLKYLNNNLNDFIKNEDPKIDFFKNKLDEINFQQFDYSIEVFKSYTKFLDRTIKLYKNYLIYFNIITDENFVADYNSLKNEYNKLSKKLLLNYLKLKLKVSALNEKINLI